MRGTENTRGKGETGGRVTGDLGSGTGGTRDAGEWDTGGQGKETQTQGRQRMNAGKRDGGGGAQGTEERQGTEGIQGTRDTGDTRGKVGTGDRR